MIAYRLGHDREHAAALKGGETRCALYETLSVPAIRDASIPHPQCMHTRAARDSHMATASRHIDAPGARGRWPTRTWRAAAPSSAGRCGTRRSRAAAASRRTRAAPRRSSASAPPRSPLCPRPCFWYCVVGRLLLDGAWAKCAGMEMRASSLSLSLSASRSSSFLSRSGYSRRYCFLHGAVFGDSILRSFIGKEKVQVKYSIIETFC